MATKANGKVKEMEGEVYYPSDEVIAQAIVKDWDATAESARKDLQGFWARKLKNWNGSRNGIRYWMIPINHSSNGSSGRKQTLSITQLTVISKPIVKINWH